MISFLYIFGSGADLHGQLRNWRQRIDRHYRLAGCPGIGTTRARNQAQEQEHHKKKGEMEGTFFTHILDQIT
jgi:hypothetical protein